MRVLILPDAAAAALRAAEIVADRLRDRPACVLGLATGETMRPIYDALVRLHRETGLSFAGATTFNLDEYVGVPPDHPASFTAYMRAALFERVDIDPARAHLPDGAAPAPQAEAERYEAAIAAAGGIDLQLLGIGRNGHLAFNEPTSSLASRTRIKTLTFSTRSANRAAFLPGEAPRQAITMGLGTILDARECLLVATGAGKADAIAATVEGPLGAHCPATVLQFHRAATLVLDEAAAAGLEHRDYYETVHPGGREATIG